MINELEDKIIGSELLSIELDGLPPTVNHMYMKVRGRVFRTEECQAYQDTSWGLCRVYGDLNRLIRDAAN